MRSGESISLRSPEGCVVQSESSEPAWAGNCRRGGGFAWCWVSDIGRSPPSVGFYSGGSSQGSSTEGKPVDSFASLNTTRGIFAAILELLWYGHLGHVEMATLKNRDVTELIKIPRAGVQLAKCCDRTADSDNRSACHCHVTSLASHNGGHGLPGCLLWRCHPLALSLDKIQAPLPHEQFIHHLTWI